MANEKRLIDANTLKIHRMHNAGANHPLDVAYRKDIDNAPTVDAVEVVHGEWSIIEDDYTGMVALQCSVCNQEYWFEDEPPIKIYNYCPNCGAKMGGGKDNE